MAEPFIGEIKMVGFNFPPRGWARCDGQLLSIAQNSALFSLLGTTFGGDGENTFGLPDLRSRSPVHVGTGPGLSPIAWGSRGGNETTTLTEGNLPSHTHDGMIGSNTEPATTNEASGNVLGAGANIFNDVPPEAGEDLGGFSQVGSTGGNVSFSNRSPYLGVYFCIALTGIYPSPS